MTTSRLDALIATLESCADDILHDADRRLARADFLRSAADALDQGDDETVARTLEDLDEFCWMDEIGSEIAPALRSYEGEWRLEDDDWD